MRPVRRNRRRTCCLSGGLIGSREARLEQYPGADERLFHVGRSELRTERNAQGKKFIGRLAHRRGQGIRYLHHVLDIGE